MSNYLGRGFGPYSEWQAELRDWLGDKWKSQDEFDNKFSNVETFFDKKRNLTVSRPKLGPASVIRYSKDTVFLGSLTQRDEWAQKLDLLHHLICAKFAKQKKRRDGLMWYKWCGRD